MADQLLRHIALLQYIPLEPSKITTAELESKLRSAGFNCTLRAVQRDLQKLSVIMPLVSDERSKPFGWSFSRDSKSPAFHALDTSTALTFFLAEQHLKHLLPPSVLKALAPQFAQAHRQLDGLEKNELSNWSERVRSLPNGKTLLPAEINEQVWNTVSEALMEKKQLDVTYLSRKQQQTADYQLHPAGLVSRHSMTYLVARFSDSEKYMHFAVNRILRASKLDQDASVDDFNLDAHIAAGNFSSRSACPEVELVADIHPQVAWILAETPLSIEQKISPLANSQWSRLTATVRMDEETLWWIFALNSQIKLYQPQEWADQIKQNIRNLMALYTD